MICPIPDDFSEWKACHNCTEVSFYIFVRIIRIPLQKQSDSSGNCRCCHGSAALDAVPSVQAAGINICSGSYHVRFHDTGRGRPSAGIIFCKALRTHGTAGIVAGAYGNDLAAVARRCDGMISGAVISAGDADDQSVIPQLVDLLHNRIGSFVISGSRSADRNIYNPDSILFVKMVDPGQAV